jgi:hypothetical protein
MRPLSTLELYSTLLAVAESNQLLLNGSSDYFKDLLQTGCRSSEPLDIRRWKLKGKELELVTEKTNNKRILQAATISEDFIRCVRDQTAPYGHASYGQLTAEMRRVQTPFPIRHNTKIIDTYLFRYYAVKSRFEDGWTVHELLNHFAWENPQIPYIYIAATLRISE